MITQSLSFTGALWKPISAKVSYFVAPGVVGFDGFEAAEGEGADTAGAWAGAGAGASDDEETGLCCPPPELCGGLCFAPEIGPSSDSAYD